MFIHFNLFDRQNKEREREIEILALVHSPNALQQPGLRQDKTKNVDLHHILPHREQEPNCLGHHLLPGWEVEEPGLELALQNRKHRDPQQQLNPLYHKVILGKLNL